MSRFPEREAVKGLDEETAKRHLANCEREFRLMTDRLRTLRRLIDFDSVKEVTSGGGSSGDLMNVRGRYLLALGEIDNLIALCEDSTLE